MPSGVLNLFRVSFSLDRFFLLVFSVARKNMMRFAKSKLLLPEFIQKLFYANVACFYRDITDYV